MKPIYKTYLTINGDKYEQWSDHLTKAECQYAYPGQHFISRTIIRKSESFVRIYRELSDSDCARCGGI